MSEQRVLMSNLKVGMLVNFHEGDNFEVVLDIYDDYVFHTLSIDGGVMQYDIRNVYSIGGFINIEPQIESIKSKLNAWHIMVHTQTSPIGY